MSGSPRFSVIIPLFNKGKHIESTLESVQAQTFEDFEVIVVDDGSTDSGPDVVRKFASARIRMITQANAGVSAARNRGVSEAKGENIAFLDADDIWTPQHLSELNRLIDAYPMRGLYSCAHAVIRDGREYRKKQPSAPDFIADAATFLAEYSKSFAIVNSSTACVPRSVLAKVDKFPEHVTKGEDVIIWIQAALAAGVAYSTVLGAYINEDAENRSDKIRIREIPFFITWLDTQLRLDKISPVFSGPARIFLYRAILFNAAGCALGGDKSNLSLYKELSAYNSIIIKTIIYILRYLPNKILEKLRKIRHRSYS